MIVKLLIPAAVGALLGALVGRLRKCPDGGCPLTQSPKRGALWGALLGVAFAVAATPGLFSPKVEMSTAVTQLSSESEFQSQVLDVEGKAVVLFHASWCGPCQRFKPTFNTVAEQLGSDHAFIGIDVDQAPALAEKYDVRGIPTVIVFDKGKVLTRFSGAPSETDLRNALN